MIFIRWCILGEKVPVLDQKIAGAKTASSYLRIVTFRVDTAPGASSLQK
jgi:hypothetical protein